MCNIFYLYSISKEINKKILAKGLYSYTCKVYCKKKKNQSKTRIKPHTGRPVFSSYFFYISYVK